MQVLFAAQKKLTMLVLGIETSCDETGFAVYDSERGLLAHSLYSQVALHADFGGVVPELASRDHVRKILPMFCLLYTSPSPRDGLLSRMPSSA